MVMVVTKKTRSESIWRWSRGCESVVCERCHNLRRGIPKRYTGPEGRLLFSARNAALKGPLFHGSIGGIACREKIACVGELKSGASAPRKGRLQGNMGFSPKVEKRPQSNVEERSFRPASRRNYGDGL